MLQDIDNEYEWGGCGRSAIGQPRSNPLANFICHWILIGWTKNLRDYITWWHLCITNWFILWKRGLMLWLLLWIHFVFEDQLQIIGVIRKPKEDYKNSSSCFVFSNLSMTARILLVICTLHMITWVVHGDMLVGGYSTPRLLTPEEQTLLKPPVSNVLWFSNHSHHSTRLCQDFSLLAFRLTRAIYICFKSPLRLWRGQIINWR